MPASTRACSHRAPAPCTHAAASVHAQHGDIWLSHSATTEPLAPSCRSLRGCDTNKSCKGPWGWGAEDTLTGPDPQLAPARMALCTLRTPAPSCSAWPAASLCHALCGCCQLLGPGHVQHPAQPLPVPSFPGRAEIPSLKHSGPGRHGSHRCGASPCYARTRAGQGLCHGAAPPMLTAPLERPRDLWIPPGRPAPNDTGKPAWLARTAARTFARSLCRSLLPRVCMHLPPPAAGNLVLESWFPSQGLAPPPGATGASPNRPQHLALERGRAGGPHHACRSPQSFASHPLSPGWEAAGGCEGARPGEEGQGHFSS